VLLGWLADLPGTLQVLRENHEVAGAETDRVFAVGYRDFALKQQAGLFLRVCPIERAGLTRPDRPGLGCFFTDADGSKKFFGKIYFFVDTFYKCSKILLRL
jgi:hypothetical protein